MEQDSLAQSTAYDSVWANSDVPVSQATGLEGLMLSDDKIFVVMAVVLIIWAGIMFYLYRTDSKLDRLERTVN